jgi:NAD(P)-dependent dehydrogenase (short-subunit alcohol dehydrogenase family)
VDHLKINRLKKKRADLEHTMTGFAERAFVVTGAAGTLGQAVARRFHGAGAKVVLVDRQKDRLSQIFPDLVDHESVFFANEVDLTQEPVVTDMMTAVHDHYGRLDGLVNTAGGYRAGKPAHKDTLKNWQFLMDLNGKTVYIVSRAIVPFLQQQKMGKIVNVGANAARSGKANMAAYIASKSAVIRLTESMAEELRPDNINVNCVLPNVIDTPDNRAQNPKADYSRWVKPEAIAEVIFFLCTDQARSIYGSSIPVRGPC